MWCASSPSVSRSLCWVPQIAFFLCQERPLSIPAGTFSETVCTSQGNRLPARVRFPSLAPSQKGAPSSHYHHVGWGTLSFGVLSNSLLGVCLTRSVEIWRGCKWVQTPKGKEIFWHQWELKQPCCRISARSRLRVLWWKEGSFPEQERTSTLLHPAAVFQPSSLSTVFSIPSTQTKSQEAKQGKKAWPARLWQQRKSSAKSSNKRGCISNCLCFSHSGLPSNKFCSLKMEKQPGIIFV